MSTKSDVTKEKNRGYRKATEKGGFNTSSKHEQALDSSN
jgi:hypothetical protein